MLRKQENWYHSREYRIQKICRFFEGRILSNDEMKEYYKQVAFDTLNSENDINWQKLKKKAGYSCWNWFLKIWGQDLASKDGYNFSRQK